MTGAGGGSGSMTTVALAAAASGAGLGLAAGLLAAVALLWAPEPPARWVLPAGLGAALAALWLSARIAARVDVALSGGSDR